MCPRGLVIDVAGAIFGRIRGDLKTCGRKSVFGNKNRILNRNCIAKSSRRVVKMFCDGNQSCSIRAKNSVFGDPCKGIFKYLVVSYKCKKRNPCKKGQFKFGNKCFEINSDPKFPSGAARYCEDKGGSMVSIRNMRMNRAISKRLARKEIPDAFIGLSDSLSEGKI